MPKISDSLWGELSSSDVVEQLKCSKPTALKWMRKLDATELCEFHDNEQRSNRPDSVTINEAFRFLIRKSTELVED